MLHDTILHTDALCKISGSWPLWFPRKLWQKLSCEQICPQYSKSRKTGSGHAADSIMHYTLQFSIQMLCAKYQEAGLCASREKCDRDFLWRRRKTTQDDRSDPYMSPRLKWAGNTMTTQDNRSDPYMSPPLKRAGDTIISPLIEKSYGPSFDHSWIPFTIWPVPSLVPKSKCGTTSNQHHDR